MEIEENKLVENQLKTLIKLSEIGQKITASLSVEEINDKVYSSLNALMDANSFGIGIFNVELDCIQFVGYIEKGKKIPTGNYFLTDETRPAVSCFKNQKVIFSNDLEKDYKTFFPGKKLPPKPIAGESVESLIYFPLSTVDKRIGVITVQSFSKNAYTEYHLDIIRNLAIYVTTALENARLFGNMEEEVKIRTREIEFQKSLIEEKHREIRDSINYAARIQRSLLASDDLLKENLKDYFIFFQPKDVVSGDFYWSTKLGGSSGGENFVLVTADSTGHGVPGAIMSILNIACLDKAVTEGITSPDLILNETRKLIIEHLKNDGSLEGGKDGMDASLLSFDFKNNIMYCASANNPIWIIRNSELIEINADRMPIGKHHNDTVPFMLHSLNLEKGDMVYSLTDGMADQFGGPLGKKFMHKQLKELLISIAMLPMIEQKQRLKTVLDNWMGNLAQIDDITIIGVRV